jgi:proton-dependent oligopeptide transporter, POT family
VSPARSRHPIGLYVLFFTEMWERFGFYCMEAVFVYYMEASQYLFLRENASQIYGLYLGGVYFTPFFGGLLAEWRLGYSASILLGGLCMALGYGLLSLEPAVCFAIGIATIIIGNGLFKPNISSLVGKLYPPGDKRIDSAFSIFYMGINIGALIAPISAAIIVNVVGKYTTWEPRYAYLAVFAVAAIGMVLGEIIFLSFSRWVIPVQPVRRAIAESVSAEPAVPPNLQSRRNLALIVFFCINIAFWMAFKQKGNTLALWARDRTDLQAPEWLSGALGSIKLDHLLLKDGLLGKELFAALNPFFVIVLTPLLIGFWNQFRRIGLTVPTPAKLVIGFALTAGAFSVMWRIAAATSTNERVSPMFLVYTYALLTLGELCLSPMGLSLVSKLAPSATRAVWMGMFFVSTAIGGYLAGGVRQYIKDWPFADFFALLTYSSLGAMVLMMVSYPLIASALKPPKEN